MSNVSTPPPPRRTLRSTNPHPGLIQKEVCDNRRSAEEIAAEKLRKAKDKNDKKLQKESLAQFAQAVAEYEDGMQIDHTNEEAQYPRRRDPNKNTTSRTTSGQKRPKPTKDKASSTTTKPNGGGRRISGKAMVIDEAGDNDSDADGLTGQPASKRAKTADIPAPEVTPKAKNKQRNQPTIDAVDNQTDNVDVDGTHGDGTQAKPKRLQRTESFINEPSHWGSTSTVKVPPVVSNPGEPMDLCDTDESEEQTPKGKQPQQRSSSIPRDDAFYSSDMEEPEDEYNFVSPLKKQSEKRKGPTSKTDQTSQLREHSVGGKEKKGKVFRREVEANRKMPIVSERLPPPQLSTRDDTSTPNPAKSKPALKPTSDRALLKSTTPGESYENNDRTHSTPVSIDLRHIAHRTTATGIIGVSGKQTSKKAVPKEKAYTNVVTNVTFGGLSDNEDDTLEREALRTSPAKGSNLRVSSANLVKVEKTAVPKSSQPQKKVVTRSTLGTPSSRHTWEEGVEKPFIQFFFSGSNAWRIDNTLLEILNKLRDWAFGNHNEPKIVPKSDAWELIQKKLQATRNLFGSSALTNLNAAFLAQFEDPKKINNSHPNIIKMRKDYARELHEGFTFLYGEFRENKGKMKRVRSSSFEGPLVIQTFTTYIRLIRGSYDLNDFRFAKPDHPWIALALSCAAIERALKLWTNGSIIDYSKKTKFLPIRNDNGEMSTAPYAFSEHNWGQSTDTWLTDVRKNMTEEKWDRFMKEVGRLSPKLTNQAPGSESLGDMCNNRRLLNASDSDESSDDEA